MLEWLKRHAWKACIRQKRISGSNPDLSARQGEGSRPKGRLFCAGPEPKESSLSYSSGPAQNKRNARAFRPFAVNLCTAPPQAAGNAQAFRPSTIPTGRRFLLQCTHVIVNISCELTGAVSRGIRLRRQLIISCVRCSEIAAVYVVWGRIATTGTIKNPSLSSELQSATSETGLNLLQGISVDTECVFRLLCAFCGQSTCPNALSLATECAIRPQNAFCGHANGGQAQRWPRRASSTTPSSAHASAPLANSCLIRPSPVRKTTEPANIFLFLQRYSSYLTEL